MDEYRKYEPIFGAWYLGRLIGKGSFGKVFEITREEFGVTYKAALKVISVPQDDEDIKARLAEGTDPKTLYDEILKEIVNENIIMSRLKGNSNIVSYEDHQIIPHEDGIGYDILIRMELLTPLIDRMMRGKLDEGEVLKLGIDICKALEICHRKNIIHRDIKPQNIFISDNGDYKLGDFGIARTIEKTTGGMSNKGTYKYMAPEVFKGEDYDSTVDIYSLGIVLYTLLNGNRGPFLPPPPAKVTHSDEEEARMRRFRGEPIPEPENAGPMLVYIIHKACANDPSDRYQTAAQMRRDLEDYQRSYIPADEMTVSTDDATTPLFAGEKSSANRGSAAAVPYGAAGSATAGSYAAAGSATAGSYAAAGSATAGSYAAAGSAADKSGAAAAAAAEKEKHASLEDILKQHKLIAVIAGSVAGTAFLVFLICILILQIAPDSGLAVGIDSFIEAVSGGGSDYDGGDDAYPDPDTYDAYLAVLEENSEGIRSYWWQKDIYDRCPNEAEGIPMTDPQNRCVAVADIFGDSEPELMYFDAAGGEKAYLNLCSSMNGEPEWLDYDASAGSYAGNAAPWGDGFFADNRDADTKYMIYTGKGADTFYIVSSMRDRLTYFCSVKYVVEDSITIRAESYVVNTYGPKEDDSGILDKYYVNGSEVSSKEGVAAFEAAADDFDDLIMLSGSDKENLKVFKRGETEKQAAAAYYEAVSSLQSKEKTAWSDPPEKPAVPENEYTVVTKDGVIVREGPGRQYRALRRTELNDEYIGRSLEGERACLKQGSKVISLGITGDWMEISAGWICITYKGESLVRKSSEL